MSLAAWVTLGVVLLVIGLLAGTRYSPDLILLAGLALLVTLGIISTAEAFAGFANEGLLTVAVLFAVAAGLRDTGAMSLMAERWLGRPKTVAAAQARLMFPVAAMSTVMNNTPLVAAMLPVVDDWAKKNRIAPSKLLIPLSYATILGGLCTLLGTSTNLILNGLLVSQARQPALNLFDPAWVGFPCALVGIGYVLAVSRWLLPDRRSPISLQDDARRYTVEMVVDADSPLIGKTIEQAGLRQLPGLYLIEIDRAGETRVAVGPDEKLFARDRLVFAGVVESVVDLQKLRGLTPATDQIFKLDSPRTHRCLIEAVVSSACPLVGKTVREGRFRTMYNAAIIAVARHGEQVRQKIGDIRLQAGDTLLLEAHPWFRKQHRNSPDFYLVSEVENSTPPRHNRAWVALLILLLMVVAASFGPLSTLNVVMLAAGLIIVTGCCSWSDALRFVDWRVLLVIGASFGIGRAMETSGAAAGLATSLIGLAAGNPWLALAAVYVVTMLFTELMSNNAAAVLVFPIALATARTLEVSIVPFVMAIMVAASCGFATPIGYQTNLMVYGPGGYRFWDYVRIGAPLNLLVAAVAILVAPLIWGFQVQR